MSLRLNRVVDLYYVYVIDIEIQDHEFMKYFTFMRCKQCVFTCSTDVTLSYVEEAHGEQNTEIYDVFTRILYKGRCFRKPNTN